MATILHPAQETLFPTVASVLNHSRGVVLVEDLGKYELEPEARTSVTRLAGQLGTALATAPRDGELTDKALEVFPQDFWHARLDSLRHGVYIGRGNPRYRKTANLIRLANEPPSQLSLPGVVPPHIGVVVGRGEFKTIARSPEDLANHAQAVTRDANYDKMNREERTAIEKRSAVHALDTKLQAMKQLDETFTEQTDVLRKVHQDAQFIWRIGYLAKNINRFRQEADELIHDMVEIAATSLDYGTTAVNAIHRSVTSDLYRRGSSRELAAAWRSHTLWTGRYINAKRGKVDQSTAACLRVRDRYEQAAQQGRG